MEFKITTINLRLDVKSDNENNWHKRSSSIIKYINQTKPLILCTQEGTQIMIDELNSRLEDYSYIGLVRKDNEEYNAIFYNKEILYERSHETFWLSTTPMIPESIDFNSACTRICTFGEFGFKTNKATRFRVFNTHLDHQSEMAKMEGIKIIVNKMNDFSFYLPTILTGDFNAIPHEPVLTYLKESKVFLKNLVSVHNKVNNYGTTFHNYQGITNGDPIDYIFLTEDIKIIQSEIFNAKIDDRYLSDHYPVSSIIEVKNIL